MGTGMLLEEEQSAESTGALWTILQTLATGVLVASPEGTLLFFNSAAEQMLGISAADRQQPSEWPVIYGWYLPDKSTLLSHDQLPLPRVMHGEEITGEVVFVRSPYRPAGAWISVDGRPVRNQEGELTAAVLVLHDVTESRRSLESNVLLSQVVEQIADGVVLTDKHGIIEFVNPAFETISGFRTEELRGRTPRVLRSGQHSHEFYRQLWNQLLEGRPFQGVMINRRKTGELYHAEETITPIRDDSGNLTHFVSVMHDATKLLSNQEQEVQLRLARQVQQQFYRSAPNVTGFDIAAAAYPAYQTSGDYYDFIAMPHGSLCVAVGDVEGHGFGSALVMALTRAYVRSFAALGLEVDQILTQVNRMLVHDLGDGIFVTLALACVDIRNRSLVYAGAGHVPGYVVLQTGDMERTLESTGPPLGLFADVRFSRSSAVPLQPGELVLLLTDGLTESSGPGGSELGAGRVLEYVRSRRQERALEIVDGLVRLARQFAANGLQRDDITSVVLKVEGEARATE